MRSKIFLYLFIFTLLFVLYQFMNTKKVSEKYDKKISNMEKRLETKDAVIDSLRNVSLDLNYFSLEGNEDAISYFENMGYDAKKLSNTIIDQIIGQNKINADNPIVPYDGMEGNMKINKIKPLNHKWIIADFTDGTYWGEILIVYFVNDDNTIDFEVKESFLYPRS